MVQGDIRWKEHYNQGRVLFEEGKLEEAKERFRKALSINPHVAETHYHLGLIYKEQGDWVDAAMQFRVTSRINPYFADAYYNLGMVLARQQFYTPAIEQFKKALQIVPDDERIKQKLQLAQEMARSKQDRNIKRPSEMDYVIHFTDKMEAADYLKMVSKQGIAFVLRAFGVIMGVIVAIYGHTVYHSLWLDGYLVLLGYNCGVEAAKIITALRLRGMVVLRVDVINALLLPIISPLLLVISYWLSSRWWLSVIIAVVLGEIIAVALEETIAGLFQEGR